MGDEFSNSGLPEPTIDRSGKAHLPQEFTYGIPMGAPKPCGALMIMASNWTREYFDRPSLIVPDTDDPAMHVYFFECNSFQNYNWTSWQKYKSRDCRRGGVIYIHRPGWYTFQNVGTGISAPKDIKCRVYDQASLWNWSAEMQQMTGYDPTTVSWKTIGATRNSLPGLQIANTGGGVLETPTTITQIGYAVTDTGADLVLADNATRIVAIITNRTNVPIELFLDFTPGIFGNGIYLHQAGSSYQIDGYAPFAGKVYAMTNTGTVSTVSVMEESW
jgi:hypothetical protein